MQSYWEGDVQGLKRHLGGFFRNYSKERTESHSHRLNQHCEGCPGHDPHDYPAGTTGKIQISHPKGRSRPEMMLDIVKADPITGNIPKCDLYAVEREYKQRIDLMVQDGSCKFLCSDGNRIWGNYEP
jgi:hypothetical protein